MRRVFFVGAGASVDDGFPLTRDLMAAVACAVVHAGPRDAHSRRLFDYLQTVYAVPRQALASAARSWQAFVEERRPIQAPPLPSIIEMLSVLDTICQEGMNLGPAPRRKGGRRPGARTVNLDSNELRRVRDRFQTALIEQFERLQDRRPPVAFERFAETLDEGDVVITTNWDLLLDRALDNTFGPPADTQSFGAPIAGFEEEEGRSSETHLRKGPWLLKVHGSLNWLWCTQCGGMTIDRRRRRPSQRAAMHDDPYGFRCPCGGQFTGLIVTPTFLKSYENHHIGSVWTRALQSLIHTDEWTFVGYSLPEDDVAVRALLLKALVSRQRAVIERRAEAKAVRVRLVSWSKSHSPDQAMLARYRQICGSALQDDGSWHGFAEWASRQPARARGAQAS